MEIILSILSLIGTIAIAISMANLQKAYNKTH